MTTVYPMFKKDLKKKKKKRRERDEDYLDFIRSQICLVCYRNGEPHHEPIKKSSGVAMKGSDRETVPLCREHHTERHNIGKLTFYWKYQIDYVAHIERLQTKYRRNAMQNK